MRKTLILSLFIGASSVLPAQEKNSGLSFVDPSIGGVGIILEPTRPTVHLPNSMVRVFPMRKDHLDDQISFFPLSIASHRLYPLFKFMPISGTGEDGVWDERFVYGPETLTPYFYKTTFEPSGISLEFSPHERSGYFRISFPDDQANHIRLGVNHRGDINIEGKRVITGTEEFAGMKAFFYAETDRDIVNVQYRESSGKSQVLISIDRALAPLSFRYGISFISIGQAKQNLQKEIPDQDFLAVKSHAAAAWEEKLDQIQVTGGTEAQKRVFYTSLYRSYERMVDINEYGKYYSAYDRRVHESDEPFYVDNWIWDTYIALEPLHMILNPEMETQKIRSWIKMYEQGGTLPSFGLVFGDWPAMTGNFAAAWIADAWSKGLRDFDLESAYAGMRKNSLEATLLPWRNGPQTSLDSFYTAYGYFPGLPPGEKETVKEVDTAWEKRQSVSVTTANSYSDWCIARIASELNKKEDEELFLKRSEFYRNVFRQEKGFMWPKDKDGNWIEPYDPRFAGREYFTENNAYIFNWDVKHDLNGLFELMGGKEEAEKKLDQLFREGPGMPKFRFWNIQPDASGLVGQYVMGNEPGLHIPYLYNYLGSPWKTQKRVRMLLNTFFMDNVFGMPGDEDGGGMSAWVVFSMMGFFQVTPGIPVYTLGSPVFEEVSIDLPNGKKFTVIARNNSEQNIYIREAFLNGEPLKKSRFTHEELMNGGILELDMGERVTGKMSDK